MVKSLIKTFYIKNYITFHFVFQKFYFKKIDFEVNF